MFDYEKLLHAAIRYAELGYEVFPVAPNEKRPLTEHGAKDATSDVEKVRSWWQRYPLANVGLACNGLLVVDVDAEALPFWPQEAEHAAELVTFAGAISMTPSGGRHYFFRAPQGSKWRCSVGKIARHVDVRTDGGYVVVPPSRMLEREYRWLDDRDLHCSREYLPTPPEWLRTTLDQLETYQAGGEVVLSQSIEHGRRNNVLFRIACRLRRFGLERDEIYAALERININRCLPPLEEKEVARIAESACRYQPDQVEKNFVECAWSEVAGGDDDSEGIETGTEEFDDPGDMPEELVSSGPGLIAEIAEYIVRTSYRSQTALALGSAISFVSALSGHKVTDEFSTKTNLYCVGIGPTGCGKERTRQAIRDIAVATNTLELIGPEDVASHAGLARYIEEKPCVLIQLDEIGRKLKLAREATANPHYYNLVTLLLRLYSAAAGVFTGTAYADKSKTKIVVEPHVVLWGTAVPDEFYEALSADSLVNGFCSRLLVFEAAKKLPRHRQPESVGVPRSICDGIAFWTGRSGKVVYRYSADATDQYVRFAQYCEERLDRYEEPYRSVWVRAQETARKLALIAAFANWRTEEVDGKSMAWAIELATYLSKRMHVAVYEHLHKSRFEQRYKEILRWFREQGVATKTQVCRKFRHLKPSERDEVLRALVESGELVVRTTQPLTGRPKTTYVLKKLAAE